MPEVDDLRKSQALLLSMLKSLRMPDEVGKGTLTRHQVGKIAAGKDDRHEPATAGPR